jgi:NADH:ubiquinone oxidoreductase subunit 3 (subunit A)
MTLNEWIFVGLFFALGWVLPATPVVLNKLLGPKRPNRIKQQTYECGVEMVGSAWTQFRAQYYIFALAFVVFDVELIFMFPWALAYNQLGLFALFEMLVFVLLLVVALIYTWRKGALEWS